MPATSRSQEPVAVRSSVAFGEFYAEIECPRAAAVGGRHGRGLDGSSRSDPKEYPYPVVAGYRGIDLLLWWAGADHRDYPGLVLTCVCDAALARGWAQGYPKRLRSIF
jgi:hypothetical protein